MIAWINKKNSCVEISMTEEKYVISCTTSHEVVWIQKLLTGLFNIVMEETCVLCNNQSCINLL
jgi:hypothetical protein